MSTAGPVRSHGEASVLCSSVFLESRDRAGSSSRGDSSGFPNSAQLVSATGSPTTAASGAAAVEGNCKKTNPEKARRLFFHESPGDMTRSGSAASTPPSPPPAAGGRGGEGRKLACSGDAKRGMGAEEEERRVRGGVGRNSRSTSSWDGTQQTGHTSTTSHRSGSSGSESGSLPSEDSWDLSASAPVGDSAARQKGRPSEGPHSIRHPEGMSSIRDSAAALLAKLLLSENAFDVLNSADFDVKSSDDPRKLEPTKNPEGLHSDAGAATAEVGGLGSESLSLARSAQHSDEQERDEEPPPPRSASPGGSTSSSGRVGGTLREQRVGSSATNRDSSLVRTKSEFFPHRGASLSEGGDEDACETKALSAQRDSSAGVSAAASSTVKPSESVARGGTGASGSSDGSFPSSVSPPGDRGCSFAGQHFSSRAHAPAAGRGGGGGGGLDGGGLGSHGELKNVQGVVDKSSPNAVVVGRYDEPHSLSGSDHLSKEPSVPSSWPSLPEFIAAFYEAEARQGELHSASQQTKKADGRRGGGVEERKAAVEVEVALPKRSTSATSLSQRAEKSPDQLASFPRKKRKLQQGQEHQQQPPQQGEGLSAGRAAVASQQHRYAEEERAAVNQLIVGGAVEACGALMKTESPTWMPPFTLHDSHRLVYELIDEFGKRRTNFSILVPKVLRLIRIFLQHAQAGKWDGPEFPAPLPTCAAFNDVGQAKTVKRLEQCFPYFGSQGGLLLCTQGRRLESGGGGKYYFQDRRGRVVGCHKHDLTQYTAQGCVSSPVLLKTLLFCLVLKPRYHGQVQVAGVHHNQVALSPVSTATTATSSNTMGSQAMADVGLCASAAGRAEERAERRFSGSTSTSLMLASLDSGVSTSESLSNLLSNDSVSFGVDSSLSLSPRLTAAVSASGDSRRQTTRASSLHQPQTTSGDGGRGDGQAEGGFRRDSGLCMGEAAGEADLWEAVTDVEKLVGQTERLISYPETALAISQAQRAGCRVSGGGGGGDASRRPLPNAALNENDYVAVEDGALTGGLDDLRGRRGGGVSSFCTTAPCCGADEDVPTTCVRSSNPQRIVRVYRSLVEEQETHVVERLLRVWSMTLHVHTADESVVSSRQAGGGRQGKQRQVGGSGPEFSDHDINEDFSKEGHSGGGTYRKRPPRTAGMKCRTDQHTETSRVSYDVLGEKKGAGWRPCVSLLWVKPLPLVQSMSKWSRRSSAVSGGDGDTEGFPVDDEHTPVDLSELVYTQKRKNGYGGHTPASGSQKLDLLPRRVTSCASTHLPSDPSSVDYSPTLLSPQSCGREVSPEQRRCGDAQDPIGSEDDLRAWVLRHLEASVRGLGEGESGGNEDATSRAVAEFQACLGGAGARCGSACEAREAGGRAGENSGERVDGGMSREARLTVEAEGQKGASQCLVPLNTPGLVVPGTLEGDSCCVSDRSGSEKGERGCGAVPGGAAWLSADSQARASGWGPRQGVVDQGVNPHTSTESRGDLDANNSILRQGERDSSMPKPEVVRPECTPAAESQFESPDVQETCGKLKSLLTHPGGSQVFQAVRTLVEAALAHSGAAGGFPVSAGGGNFRPVSVTTTGGEATPPSRTPLAGGASTGGSKLPDARVLSCSPQTPATWPRVEPSHRASCLGTGQSGQGSSCQADSAVSGKDKKTDGAGGESPAVSVGTEGGHSGRAEVQHVGKSREGFVPVLVNALKAGAAPGHEDDSGVKESLPLLLHGQGEGRETGPAQKLKRSPSESGCLDACKGEGVRDVKIERPSGKDYSTDGKEGCGVEGLGCHQGERVFEDLQGQLETHLELQRPVSRQQLEALLMHMLRVEEPGKVAG